MSVLILRFKKTRRNNEIFILTFGRVRTVDNSQAGQARLCDTTNGINVAPIRGRLPSHPQLIEASGLRSVIGILQSQSLPSFRSTTSLHLLEGISGMFLAFKIPRYGRAIRARVQS